MVDVRTCEVRLRGSMDLYTGSQYLSLAEAESSGFCETPGISQASLKKGTQEKIPKQTDAGGEKIVDKGSWKFLFPGIVLACMILSPGALAGQDQTTGENLMSSSYFQNLIPPDMTTRQGIDTPLSTGEGFSTPPGMPDPTPYSSITASSASGTVSAWANQGSSSGSTRGSASIIEFKQVVTASGNIHKFMFSASVVL